MLLQSEKTPRGPRLVACRVQCRYVELWPGCTWKLYISYWPARSFQFTYLGKRCPSASWLHLLLKYLHVKLFPPVMYTFTSMLPDEIGVLTIKNILSASLLSDQFLVLHIFFAWHTFALIYVWGRNSVCVVQQQWADLKTTTEKNHNPVWYYWLFWIFVVSKLLQKFF